MNGVPVGDCLLSVIHHRSDYKIDCGDIDNEGSIIFSYGCGTPSSTSIGDNSFSLNDHGMIVTRHSNVTHQRKIGSYEFVINCPRNAVERRLQSSLDRHTSRKLTFDETVPMDTASGVHAKATMSYIINSLDSNPGLLHSPVVLSKLRRVAFGNNPFSTQQLFGTARKP